MKGIQVSSLLVFQSLPTPAPAIGLVDVEVLYIQSKYRISTKYKAGKKMRERRMHQNVRSFHMTAKITMSRCHVISVMGVLHPRRLDLDLNLPETLRRC